MHKAIKNITFTPAIQHTAKIEFPNGNGYTPCTQEYRDTLDAKNNICNPNHGDNVNDLPAELYQEFSVLDDKLMNLQIAGHLGKSVRY